MIDRKKLQTRSMYRSVRYRVNRDNDTRTADPSSCNFRIKRNSCFESTMARTTGSGFPTANMTIQLLPAQKSDRGSYLQSFHSMMQRNGPTKLRRDHITSIRHRNSFTPVQNNLQETKDKQFSFFNDRVYIPDFNTMEKQVNQSQHALLTPFNTPFSHVKNIYVKVHKQLNSQQQQVKQIKAGLKHIQKSKNKEIQQIQKYAKQQFQLFRGILRKNQIQQQQKKLKTKRQLHNIEENHNKNMQKFRQIVNRSSNLQTTIFNSTPYNLKQRQQYGNQIQI